jgi:Luciferase
MKSLDTLLSRELQMPSLASTGNLWSRTRLVKEIKQVLDAAKMWLGVVIQPDRYGLQFLAGEAELGYLRWDGLLELPFPSDLRDRLFAEEMAAHRPDLSGSDRAVWIVRTPADVDRAIWLLRLSYLLSCADLETHVAADILQFRDHL